jgi:hypothetical protein
MGMALLKDEVYCCIRDDADLKVVAVRFMTLFVARRDSAYPELRSVTLSPL